MGDTLGINASTGQFVGMLIENSMSCEILLWKVISLIDPNSKKVLGDITGKTCSIYKLCDELSKIIMAVTSLFTPFNRNVTTKGEQKNTFVLETSNFFFFPSKIPRLYSFQFIKHMTVGIPTW